MISQPSAEKSMLAVVIDMREDRGMNPLIQSGIGGPVSSHMEEKTIRKD